MDEQNVGNNLLHRRIVLRRGSCGEKVVCAVEQGGEKMLDVEVETLEGAELVEKRAAHHKNHFVFHERGMSGGASVKSSGIAPENCPVACRAFKGARRCVFDVSNRPSRSVIQKVICSTEPGLVT
jgi:hypothetical protein